MTPRLTAETFCFAPAQTFASPSRVRWSSGCRPSTPHHRAGVHSHSAQASPTRPEQPSLASVGGGMAAGAAFAHPRAADVGSVRSFSTLYNANDRMTHASFATSQVRRDRRELDECVVAEAAGRVIGRLHVCALALTPRSPP